MNKQILKLLSNYPALYEKSSNNYWDDGYISKQILKAHLSLNVDSASRNIDFMKRSVKWITSLNDNKSGVKLLDLGCGPGLYAQLFSDYNYEVVGIDFSKRSIDYANSQLKSDDKITYIYDNYLNINYDNEFDVIILIYCDYGTLVKEDRLKLLNKAYNALNDNGILIIDGFSTNHLKNFKDKESFAYEKYGFWSEKPYLVIERFKHYKKTNNILEQYIVIDDEKLNYYNIFNQVFTKDSLINEFQQAKFDDLSFYDDVAGKELSASSDTICVVAKKRL